MFSWMCLGLEDPGTTLKPFWMCQRMMTWAADLPWAAAISLMTGSRRISPLLSRPPSGWISALAASGSRSRKDYVYIKSNPVFHLENGERTLIETDFRAFRLRIGTPMKLFSEEIIGSMHFSSQAMLTRYMKRTVGKTPTEYWKQVVSVH